MKSSTRTPKSHNLYVYVEVEVDAYTHAYVYVYVYRYVYVNICFIMCNIFRMYWVIALTTIVCVLDGICLAQQVQPETRTNIDGNLSNVSSHQRTQLNVPSEGYDKLTSGSKNTGITPAVTQRTGVPGSTEDSLKGNITVPIM